MRILAIGTVLTISLMINPVSGTESHRKSIAWSAQTVTKSVSTSVRLPRVPRPKLLRSNPYRASYFLAHWDDNDDIDIDDDDKITGPRREQFGRVKVAPTPDDPEGDITPDIEWRLFLIRTAVMAKFQITQA
mgnify:CR=1 FL=1